MITAATATMTAPTIHATTKLGRSGASWLKMHSLGWRQSQWGGQSLGFMSAQDALTGHELAKLWCAILGLNLPVANMRVGAVVCAFSAVSCGYAQNQPKYTTVLKWTQQPSNIHVCG